MRQLNGTPMRTIGTRPEDRLARGGDAIEVRGLRKAYGPQEVLHGLDLPSLRARSSPSSGRTAPARRRRSRSSRATARATAARCACSASTRSRADGAFRARIGIVLQSSAVYPTLSVREILRLFAGYYPAPRDPDEVVGLVGLEEKRDARVRTLSGGQLRRLDLASRSSATPSSSSWTSRRPASTRRRAARRGRRSAACGASARRSSSPRTTWRRRRRSPTGSRSSGTAASSRPARRESSSTVTARSRSASARTARRS